ncbi:DUF4391 domain-containing protein [Schwartzia succinivorans]|jgi:hypothetical protein|uniref:DUF4391 domain-containing protein n=1 Tax=Schwartzia succinivorans DSM 10502 TaxID=1123243 RepID=A0A1M5B313_9FIRM|nr:DUF4391 domain-containing protein [Schwartzia succinivorans]SHF36893.1 protein of unknown function [Schwartzia succinivorans DSM 10502]
MFDLPRSTEIRKPIHKKLIYQKFSAELDGEKRKRFDEDISRITVTNEISEKSVNIRPVDEVSSIFVIQIELKSKEYNERNIALVSKLFGQKLLLVLHVDGEYQLAIYETQLLKSEWKKEAEIKLRIDGLDLRTVWNSFVTAVSGISAQDGNTLSEQIGIEAEKERLKKIIVELERKARKEVQSKRKFELHRKIGEYKKRLEVM